MSSSATVRVSPSWLMKNFWTHIQVTRISIGLLRMPQPSSDELCPPSLFTNHQVLWESTENLTACHSTSSNGEGFAANWHPAPHVHRQDRPATLGNGQGDSKFGNFAIFIIYMYVDRCRIGDHASRTSRYLGRCFGNHHHHYHYNNNKHNSDNSDGNNCLIT